MFVCDNLCFVSAKCFLVCMYVTYVYPHAFMFSGLYLILYFCACMYVDIPQAPLDEFRGQQIRRGRLRPRSSRPYAMYTRRVDLFPGNLFSYIVGASNYVVIVNQLGKINPQPKINKTKLNTFCQKALVNPFWLSTHVALRIQRGF